MTCTKCGAVMDQIDKNTMSGRVIREYECRKCGNTDWADEGIALWKVMHDAREEDKAEAAAQAALPKQNPRTSLWERLARLFRGKKKMA
jgi:predicted  nucleic acid-binding Zn-ribbon protein